MKTFFPDDTKEDTNIRVFSKERHIVKERHKKRTNEKPSPYSISAKLRKAKDRRKKMNRELGRAEDNGSDTDR